MSTQRKEPMNKRSAVRPDILAKSGYGQFRHGQVSIGMECDFWDAYGNKLHGHCVDRKDSGYTMSDEETGRKHFFWYCSAQNAGKTPAPKNLVGPRGGRKSKPRNGVRVRTATPSFEVKGDKSLHSVILTKEGGKRFAAVYQVENGYIPRVRGKFRTDKPLKSPLDAAQFVADMVQQEVCWMEPVA